MSEYVYTKDMQGHINNFYDFKSVFLKQLQ
jgi:hypothetical protein